MKTIEMLKKIFFNISYLLWPKRALYYISKDEFRKKLMDPQFNWKKYDKQINPYFEKWGFRFSMMEAEYFSQCTGVESDLYVPTGLFNHYILPYLNNTSWRIGFADKNIARRMLDIDNAQNFIDVVFPECIVSCQNGRYFVGYDRLASFEEVVEKVITFNDDFIIKPSVDSSHGHGVRKIAASEINREAIVSLFKDYGKNFTVQKVIKQHPTLALFNPTSVNTIRITTYQDFNNKIKILYAAQRFGGKGKIYDNADDPKGSGGFCAIDMDGTINRVVHHYRNQETGVLSDCIPEKIPNFEKIKDAVVYLHSRFPHFGLIGWDASLTPDGHPIIIEYNFVPGIGTGQLANHPFFSKEDLDEIMKRLSSVKTSLSVHVTSKRI